ncbi:MAG: Arginine-tRNA ligase [uncultured bacterium]|nr:MAG: Arginine-tRNA ligase [uncultured bacterium]
MISEKIRKLVAEALKKSGLKADFIPIEKPGQREHGDFSTSIALKLGGNPRELAAKIIKNLPQSDFIEKTEVAGPGFINFHLGKKALQEQIGKEFKHSDSLKGRKIMIEFAHPNTHKAFHIGHLRNISLGESLVRILESQGAEIFRANYQGDIGLHVAKCLWGYMRSEEPADLDTPRKKAEFLGKVYALGGTKFEEDEEAKKEIYAINKRIYAHDPSIMPLWEKTRKWSLEYFDYIYERLGARFDRLFFESEVFDLGKKIVLEHLEKGVFEESDGAIIFPGEKYGLHNRVFITGEGNPTYEAKEMGLAKLEQEAFPFDRNIHIVANEQEDYLKVTFKAMDRIYPGLEAKQYHLSYGMVKLTTGKMSSRTGDVVTAEALIEEAKEALRKITKDEDVIEKVAIGAMKFTMLHAHAKNDIAFDLEKAVKLEGDSGPYLQYAYARISSVLDKVRGDGEADFEKFNDEDWDLSRELGDFEYSVARAAEELSPHYIAHYLIELASRFSKWYGKNNVKDAEPGLQVARLELLKAVRRVLKEGLNLLGIEVMERM